MKYIAITLIITFGLIDLPAQEKWSAQSRKPLGNIQVLPESVANIDNTIHTSRVVQTAQGNFTVGPNFRVLPNSNQQDEIILVKSYVNPLVMFGSANTTVGAAYGQAAYITTNGGTNWFGTDVIPSFTFQTSDPAPTIDKDGTLIITTLNISNPIISTMNATVSTNNGTSWQQNVIITSLDSDKNFSASDDANGSTYYGRSYTVWSNFAASNPPIVISYTTNGGTTWSSPFQINTPPSGHYSQGCDIAIGPAGQVYVCWAAPINGSQNTEDFLGFAKSTNGGANWTVSENAYDMNGIRSPSYNGWGVRVNGFPRIAIDRSGGTRNGWIYIVQSQVNLSPAGSDADVILHKSTDGGVTWSTGIRVNQDALNNGKVQFFPAICVDQYGSVDICYYDNRNYPSVGDSCETFLSRSTDGGTTWTDFAVSDHRWKVQIEPGAGSGYMGDYIGISTQGNKVWPFWFDNKTGSMQAWTAQVDITPIAVETNSNNVPADYSLGQNYPNPFNPATNIKFDIPKAGHVKLAVYDMLGNQVTLLVNNEMKAGSYSTDFNAANISSGVYFYRIEANDFVQTKKMILTK